MGEQAPVLLNAHALSQPISPSVCVKSGLERGAFLNYLNKKLNFTLIPRPFNACVPSTFDLDNIFFLLKRQEARLG